MRNGLARPVRARSGEAAPLVRRRRSARVAAVVALALLVWPAAGGAHKAKEGGRLAKIGPAPEFTLTTTEGGRLSLSELRGKVVAVTFIYATCTDACPLLTAKMAEIQKRLGADFGPKVRFVSITVDPERDTPAVLAQYARNHGANPAGWAFLTGTPAEIRDVGRGYGIYARKNSGGDVDHTFLTSIVDQHGTLRVQYLGIRFDPDEFLRDVRSLLPEAKAP
jgi:protein SCO1/2